MEMDSESDSDFESVNLSDVEESSDDEPIPSSDTRPKQTKASAQSTREVQTQKQPTQKRMTMAERMDMARQTKRRREEEEKKRIVTQEKQTAKRKTKSNAVRDATPDIAKRAANRTEQKVTPSPAKAKRTSKKQLEDSNKSIDVDKDTTGVNKQPTKGKKKDTASKKKINTPQQSQKDTASQIDLDKPLRSPPEDPQPVTIVEPTRKKERQLFGAAKTAAEKKRKQLELAQKNQSEEKERSAVVLKTPSENVTGKKSAKKIKPDAVRTSPRKTMKQNSSVSVAAKAKENGTETPTKETRSGNGHQVVSNKKKGTTSGKKGSAAENVTVPKSGKKGRPAQVQKNEVEVEKIDDSEDTPTEVQTKKRGRGDRVVSTASRKRKEKEKVVEEKEEDDEVEELVDVDQVEDSSPERVQSVKRARTNKQALKPSKQETKDDEDEEEYEPEPQVNSSEEYEEDSGDIEKETWKSPVTRSHQITKPIINRRISLPTFNNNRENQSNADLASRGLAMIDEMEKEYLLFLQKQDHVIDSFFAESGSPDKALQMLNNVMTPHRSLTHAEKNYLRDEKLQTRINAAKWELRLKLHEQLQEFTKKVSSALADVGKSQKSSLRDLFQEKLDTAASVVTPPRRPSITTPTFGTPHALHHISNGNNIGINARDDDDDRMNDVGATDNEGNNLPIRNQDNIKRMTNVAEMKEYLGNSFKRLGLRCYRSEVICKLCDTPEGRSMDELKDVTPMGKIMLRNKLNELVSNNLVIRRQLYLPNKKRLMTVFTTNEEIRHLR